MKMGLGSLLVFVVGRSVQAAPLTIVEDGEARGALIVAANEPQARKAAAGIQEYLEKMSGARLDIREESDPPSGEAYPVHIYVGHTARAKAEGIHIPSGFDPSIHADAFEEEGYVLRTKGSRIFIGGNSDGPYRGTLYGAYAFLEKLGCRWYFPGEWGEIVPERKTVTVPPLQVESHPDFPLRFISAGGGWVEVTPEEREIYADWGAKIGFNTGHEGMYPLVGDGFLGCLLPFKDYWEEHPEYYAMDEKGNRVKGDIDHTTMLCLSNPHVFTEIVKNLREAFAGRRQLANASWPNGFGISPPDGTPYCYCENCRRNSQNFIYPRYFGSKPTMSEEFFHLAVKLAREFPDKWVATMAYSLREMPPQGVHLLPNMTVMYAPITCCALHPNNHPSCWRRQEFVKMLRQWRRQTPHVYLYDYNPHFFYGLYVPLCPLKNLAVDVPLYKEMDLKGISAEGRKAFMQTWISFYVTAKLLWDADTDVEALKEEFYTTFFGAAAGPHVQAWWDACEEALGKSTVHVTADPWVNHIYTAQFVRGIRKHVEAARNAELTAAQRERVEAFALIADNLQAYAEMQEADQRLDYAGAAEILEHLMEIQERLHRIYPFFITPRQMPGSSHFAPGRQRKYEQLAAMTGGERGTLVAPLPLHMRFARDPFNEGVIGEWYAPGWDDTDWDTKNTFLVSSAQDEPMDDKGHGHTGYAWYRGTVEVPERFKNQPIHFWCGGALNEAWVWVNGQYAGHHPYRGEWHPYGFNLDVSGLIQPGERNHLAIRVWNQTDLGGLYHRGFFWSPRGEAALEGLYLY